MLRVIFLFTLFFAVSCSSKEFEVISVDISVYDPFPPKTDTDKHKFLLTSKEVAEVNALIPNLYSHDGKECSCGVDPFYITLNLKNGESFGAHFFHGKNKLRVFPSDSSGGSITVSDDIYLYFYNLIVSRGYNVKKRDS